MARLARLSLIPLVLAACGDDDGTMALVDSPAADGSAAVDTAATTDTSGGGDAAGASMTVAVGGSGGIVEVSGATLVIPAGALASEVTVTVTRTDEVGPFGQEASPVYLLLPAGQTFATPVTFTLHLTTPAPSDYYILWTKAGVTNPTSATDYDVPATTRSGNDASASGTHFSEVFGARLAAT